MFAGGTAAELFPIQTLSDEWSIFKTRKVSPEGSTGLLNLLGGQGATYTARGPDSGRQNESVHDVVRLFRTAIEVRRNLTERFLRSNRKNDRKFKTPG